MRPKPDRPQMPPAYGIGRDGSAAGELLPWSTVEEWLRAASNYWVCTTRSDGRPHAKPVWGIWMEEMLVFSTAPASVTGRNLQRDPRTVIHGDSGDETVILEGQVQPLDEELFERFADAYDAKYDYRPPATGGPPWALHPDKALSWTEAEFPSTATRWSF